MALESLRRIDHSSRAARTFYNLNRWVSIRIDIIGGLFASTLATYLVYVQDTKSSTTGFSLNMAGRRNAILPFGSLKLLVGFSSMIIWWVRWLNEFEVEGTSSVR
jgi:hypothetical protein